MKIAYFLGGLNRGGAESLVLDVCKKNSELPYEVCCIYRKEGDYSDAFHSTNVRLLRLQRKRSLLGYISNFRKLVLSEHVDIVHAQTPSNALVCIFALAFTRVKIVTTFHGFSFSDASRWQRKLVYGKSSRIVCVSEFEKKHYVEKWELPIGNKIEVVYNGIDFSKFDSFDSVAKGVNNDGCDGGLLKMMMVGSFIGGRSQLFVCKVMKALRQRQIPFEFYFAGRRDAAESQRYDDCVSYCEQNGLDDCVHFLGERKDIPDLLKEMDLFVYASEHDTFGIAVLEALAAGVPVIVNDWVVMKEITENGKYAELYKTDDVNDCMEKIIRFIENKNNKADELAERKRTVAAEIRRKYSIENHIRKLNNVYQSCMK